MERARYVRWFGELRSEDVAQVGGKNASLGELYSALTAEGVKVPNGFALTAEAYRDALDKAGAWERLKILLKDLGGADVQRLAANAAQAREIVHAATGTEALRSAAGRRLSAARKAVWRGRCRGRAQLGHGRGSADGEFRRPARELPQRPRPGRAVRGVPPLLCLGVHRSRHRLSQRQRLRPSQDRPLRRGDEDGALRSRRQRGRLHARYGIGLPRRRPGHGLVRPRRERRPGPGRSGRILRPQADLQERLPRRAATLAGTQATAHDLRCGIGRPEHRQRRDARRRPRALLHRRRRRPQAGRLRHPDRAALLAPRRSSDAHGHRMGEGRGGWRALHRAGTAGDGGLAAACAGLPDLCAQGQRDADRRRARHRREDRQRSGADRRQRPRPRRLPDGGRAGSGDHEPGLGAGDETGRRHRDQSRRPHLPRRDRGAGAGRSGDRRRGGRHGQAQHGRPGHRFLRRGRDRPRVSGAGSVRHDGRRPGDARPAAHADHGQSRQPRPRLPDRHAPQRRRRAWRAWNSSSASRSASIRWRWCNRRK